MNRIYGVVILSVLSSAWVHGSDFLASGAAKASSAQRLTESSKNDLTAQQVTDSVKMQCHPLAIQDPLGAAMELWMRLKALEKVLKQFSEGIILSESPDLNLFLGALPDLIKVYSEPLGLQKYSVETKEATLIEHAAAAAFKDGSGSAASFYLYWGVEKILKADRDKRSKAAFQVSSTAFHEGASGSESSASGLSETMKLTSNQDVIAAAVREACKPFKAIDSNRAAKELWERLKRLERLLTRGYSAKEEAQKFLDNLEGLIKNYSSPLGEQKFNAIALDGQPMKERTLIKHVDAAEHDLKGNLDSPYFSFYREVEKILEKDLERRQSSKASPSAGTSSTLSSQPTESMEKKPSPEEIAAAVKAASKPLTAIGPNEAAKELWGRLKQLEQFLTKNKGQDEAKEFLDRLPTMLSKYSIPLGVQKFRAQPVTIESAREATLEDHVVAAKKNGENWPHYFFYNYVASILSQDAQKILTSRSTSSDGEREDAATAAPSAPSPTWVKDGPLLAEGQRDRGRLISGRAITYVGAGLVTLLAVYFGYDLLSGSKKAGKTVVYTG